VQLIFDKFVADGWSLAQIRDYLNNAKIRTQLGSNWTVVIVKKILKNKCYIGYLNYNQRGEKSCIKGKHAPIVDVDIFEKAQEKLALASHRVKRSRELVNPLASLVKCSKCGFTMQKTNSVFRCKNIACDMVSSLFVVVEKKIIDELKVELKNFNYFLENYGEEIEKKRTSASRELLLLQKEVDKKDKMLTRACEMLELGVYTQEKYLERVNVLESDKKALQGQISALEVAFNGEDMKIKKAIPILEKCLDEYWKLSPQQKNDLLKSFIDRVEYTKTKRLNGWTVKNDDLELKIYLKI
jgi:site-specific DNA recombinase